MNKKLQMAKKRKKAAGHNTRDGCPIKPLCGFLFSHRFDNKQLCHPTAITIIFTVNAREFQVILSFFFQGVINIS